LRLIVTECLLDLDLLFRSILEDLRAWDTATQLKSSMQKHTNDGLATKISTRSESSAVSAISKRPQTAVQRERTAVGKEGITRPTSAAPAFVRQELFVDEQNVKDEDEHHEEMDNTTLRGASLSALSLFDGKEDGNGGAAQVRDFLCTMLTFTLLSIQRCNYYYCFSDILLLCRARIHCPRQLLYKHRQYYHHRPHP
jgi:hypothetical protein